MRRVVDITLGSLLLALSSPLIALCALAIKLSDRGPVFYLQDRVGKKGRRFRLWKLRTMVVGAEAMGAGIAVDEGDPRITRIGALLRRFSADELPNLFNVLVGDMSIVGPRPTVPEQVEQYTPRQRRRLEVKPGITGWAQVNGRASLPWDERIELDIHYVENRSPALDLRILTRTARLLLTGRGLYRGSTGGWRPTGSRGSGASPESPPQSRSEAGPPGP